MTKIDKSKPVMVTGATGYVAGYLVKKLLAEGITVHAAVRDPENKNKTAHLDKLAQELPGNIKYFKSDLLDFGSYKEAMEGCELIFHTASPFTVVVDNPQKDLIDPAVQGTENVLKSAIETSSVKRIVLTSSCAAMYTDNIDSHKAPGGRLTEEVWNTTASIGYQPYAYSKTLAEKRAWELTDTQTQFDLVAINPALVLGPPLNPKETTSESFNILTQMGDGSFKSGAPRIHIGLVDVRDVAEAHYKAGFTPEASGRYITFGHSTDFYEMAKSLIPKYGNKLPLPKSVIPKWLIWLIGPFVNKALSRKYIKNNVNVEWKADNSKIIKELYMNFRSIRETLEDSMQVLIEEGVFDKK